MSDLIDRQAAIDAVNEWLKLYVINRTMSNVTSIQDILRQLPSAQPEKMQLSREDATFDCISRQSAYATVLAMYVRCDGDIEGYRDLMCESILVLPSAQPEIIVCADCKHWVCHDRRCGYWNHGVKPLDWCSYAERRTDGADVNT